MQKINNSLKNLIAQKDALKSNVGSFGTRIRYDDGYTRFLAFVDENFHIQKLANIKDKHVYAYVEYLKNSGAKPTTIRTELCAILYFHKLTGSRNQLPENNKLHLANRETGTINRAWLPEEIEKALKVADQTERVDVKFGIKTAWLFGLRIHEAAKLRVEDISRAIQYGELMVKGKGGFVRSIRIHNKAQEELLAEILAYAKENKLEKGDRVVAASRFTGVGKEISSLKAWVYNHRHRFTVENRISLVSTGEKDRSDKLTFHGLRYTYTQDYSKHLRLMGTPNAARKLSESLGHHRESITQIYMAEKNGKKAA